MVNNWLVTTHSPPCRIESLSSDLNRNNKWSSAREKDSTSLGSLPLILKSFTIQSTGTCWPKLRASSTTRSHCPPGLLHLVLREQNFSEVLKLVDLRLQDLVAGPRWLPRLTLDNISPTSLPLAGEGWPPGPLVPLLRYALHPKSTTHQLFERCPQ